MIFLIANELKTAKVVDEINFQEKMDFDFVMSGKVVFAFFLMGLFLLIIAFLLESLSDACFGDLLENKKEKISSLKNFGLILIKIVQLPVLFFGILFLLAVTFQGLFILIESVMKIITQKKKQKSSSNPNHSTKKDQKAEIKKIEAKKT
jgi:hypothetical protein